MPKSVVLIIHRCDCCPYFKWTNNSCGKMEPPIEIENPDNIPEW